MPDDQDPIEPSELPPGIDGPLDRGLEKAFGENRSDSVLERIREITGIKPSVSLQDVDQDKATPVLKPLGKDDGIAQENGKYTVHGLLGQGGVGAVHKGHDAELGRDVAMKFLHEKYRDEPTILQRFVEEAQIGGQLQHPGIVPVYELGMSDGRPFFTMKMVKGQTLARVLADRESPASDRHRFLAIFEQICQTMAYAHARGVVHRDLKPANVMIGSFGEVQVVDWGMGKVLERGGVADEAHAAKEDSAASVIETVRSSGHGTRSLVGSVMGTPAYMPPEQARGDVQAMDARSDVFALGAMLCEILTGEPPYVGPPEELLAMAAMCRLADAKQRLSSCGAEPELVELAEHCLMPAPSARPKSAERIAKRVHDHLAAAEQRVHEATIRTIALKRTQKLGIALSLALVVTAVLFASWWRAADDHASALEEINRQQKQEIEQREKRLAQASLATRKMQAFLTPVAEQVENTDNVVRRVQASSQMKEVMVAMHNHYSVYSSFPTDVTSEDGTPLLSWRVRILPFLGANELYGRFRLDEPWDSEHNLALLPEIPDVYARVVAPDHSKPLREAQEMMKAAARRAADPNQPFDEQLTIEYLQLQLTEQLIDFAKRSGVLSPAPSANRGAGNSDYRVDKSDPTTVYQGLEGLGTMFEPGRAVSKGEVRDGMSTTLMLVEAGEAVPWTKPGGLPFDAEQAFPELGGLDLGTVFYVATVDGRILPKARDFDREILTKMATHSGGEAVR